MPSTLFSAFYEHFRDKCGSDKAVADLIKVNTSLFSRTLGDAHLKDGRDIDSKIRKYLRDEKLSETHILRKYLDLHPEIERDEEKNSPFGQIRFEAWPRDRYEGLWIILSFSVSKSRATGVNPRLDIRSAVLHYREPLDDYTGAFSVYGGRVRFKGQARVLGRRIYYSGYETTEEQRELAFMVLGQRHTLKDAQGRMQKDMRPPIYQRGVMTGTSFVYHGETANIFSVAVMAYKIQSLSQIQINDLMHDLKDPNSKTHHDLCAYWAFEGHDFKNSSYDGYDETNISFGLGPEMQSGLRLYHGLATKKDADRRAAEDPEDVARRHDGERIYVVF